MVKPAVCGLTEDVVRGALRATSELSTSRRELDADLDVAVAEELRSRVSEDRVLVSDK